MINNNFSTTKAFAYRNIFLVVLLSVYFISSAQTRHTQEIQLSSDNDSYTLQGKDGYYTNGLKIAFRWRNKNDTSSNTIRSVEIGQLMYNAKNGSYKELYELDRPVTAFLYGAYSQVSFTKGDDVIKWNITAGIIGPPAFGRQMQNAIHSTLGMYTPEEWNFQLNTEFGINGHVEWSPKLKGIHNDHFDLKPVVGGTIGNTFTNVNAGVAILLGVFNSNSESVFWNANLNSTNKESFFYLYPQMIFKAYDATVQGGLFRHDKGKYVGVLNHELFAPRIGWIYCNKGFLLNLALSYESRESLTQQDAQFYGTIGLGFCF